MTRGPVRAFLAGLVLSAGLAAGCASSALQKAEAADQLHDYDLAVAHYATALRQHPNSRDAQIGLDRAKLRASEAHLFRGRQFEGQGRYEDAVGELQIAAELNPTNSAAATELRKVRLAIRAQLSRQEGDGTALESILAQPRVLGPGGYDLPETRLPSQIATGQQSTVRSVYQTIAALAGLSVTFDVQFRDVPYSARLLSGQTVRQALNEVAASTDTFYRVTGPTAIQVIPDTPAKRRDYTEEVVGQFPIQNVPLTEAADVFRIVLDAREITQIKGTNTMLVRDTPERLKFIGDFLGTFDKAEPQVIVDVEVLEVDRNKLTEYGLQIASPGSPGIDGAADVNQPGGITLQTLKNLSAADVTLTGIPALYYRLLKSDTRTRTLANTHIRILDGTQAIAKFGDEVPVPTTVIAPITQGGANIQPQTSFAYKTVGVNITMTPRTHPNDEVTMALNVELSSLGAPGFQGLPTFGNRNVTTSLRLKDGETNILAGLIREDERWEKQTIPGLGDVPVLGQLFARNHKEAQHTDVVVMLTPHIVQGLNLTPEDLRLIRVPTEGAGATVLESSPIVPPPPTLPAPAITVPGRGVGAGPLGQP